MGSVDELVNEIRDSIIKNIGEPFLYMGYNCLIKQYTNAIGESHFCAYVKLPPVLMMRFHSFNPPHTMIKMNEELKLNVPGGITYISNTSLIDPFDNHLNLPGYWFGWDYMHIGDENTTVFDVMEDIQSVVQQLKYLELEGMYGREDVEETL